MPRDPDAQDWLTKAPALKSSRRPRRKPNLPESQQSIYERMMAFGEETARVERMIAFGEETRQREAANRMAAAFGGLPRSQTGTPEERRASSFGGLPVQGAVYGAAAVRAEQERGRRMVEEPIPPVSRYRAGRGRPPPTVGQQTVLRVRLANYYAGLDAPPAPYAGDGGYYYPRYRSGGGGYSGGEDVKTWLNALYSWDI